MIIIIRLLIYIKDCFEIFGEFSLLNKFVILIKQEHDNSIHYLI